MALDIKAAVKIQASVDGTASINGLEKSLTNLDRKADGLNGTFGKFKKAAGGMTGALGALVPAVAIGGLVAVTKGAIDAADHLNDLSQRTGVAVETLSKFGAAADDSGSNVDEVAKAMGRLSKGLVAATTGADEYATKIKSASDDALEAIRNGERDQTDLVRDQGRARIDALQQETDSRLRELNIRYRREQTLLDDSYDDRANAERNAADESNRLIERQINQRYDKLRDAIEADQSLSDLQRDAKLESLKYQEEDEMSALKNQFSNAQKLRDRQIRDIKKNEENALEERRIAEESIIKKNNQAQSSLIQREIDKQLEAVKTNHKNAVDEFENNSKGIGTALQKLGISATNSIGAIKPVDTLMLEIADKFAAMEDGAKKSALAQDLFGKSGTNLIPMLNQGSEALSKYKATITAEDAKAADQFNDSLNKIARVVAGPFNQAVTALLPLITQVAEGIASLAKWFVELPQPMQTALLIVGGLVTALVALAPAIASIITIGTALAGIGPVLTGLATVAAVVFTGPVGIAALVIAAGVAIYAFRDQIGAAFTAIGEYFKQLPAGFKSFFIDPLVEGFKLLMEMINTTFIQPVKEAFTATLEFINVNFVQPIQTAFTVLVESIKTIFASVVDFITRPFKAAFEIVRGIVNQILNSIGSAIGSVVNAINGVIQGVNQGLAAAKLPQIPLLPAPNIPRFAEGGVVSGPTLAMVGEGGEPEYIVPQSKAGKFANNWLSGVRGAAAIPKFAEGGVVVPGNAQVSIQTGPVTQMDGTNYVTTQDLSRAVQSGVRQTLNMLRNDSSARRIVGMA